MERNQANLPVGETNMAPQEGIVLAAKLEAQLKQIRADIDTQLVNNDYQGDFFRLGDTVKIVAIDPNSIKVVIDDKNDIRPDLDTLTFGADYMTIDKQMLYGFQIKDLDRVEDKWAHEAAALALAAEKMRQAHNLEVIDLILGNTNIAHIGTPTAPVQLTADTAGQLLYQLIIKAKGYLKAKGVIAPDGTYGFGTNGTVQHRTAAALFMPLACHTALLTSQYIKETERAEDVIRTGKFETIAGLAINVEPALGNDGLLDKHAAIFDQGTTTANGVIILGTKNLVTRAAKVLNPEKLRDAHRFADNYYGREIYGQRVAMPEACIVIYVQVPEIGGQIVAGAQIKDTDTLKAGFGFGEEGPTRDKFVNELGTNGLINPHDDDEFRG